MTDAQDRILLGSVTGFILAIAVLGALSNPSVAPGEGQATRATPPLQEVAPNPQPKDVKSVAASPRAPAPEAPKPELAPVPAPQLALPAPAAVSKEVVKEVPKEVIKEVIKEVPAAVVPPPDRDGDGIPDSLDQCPDTVAGASVETDGCVRKAQVVALPNIEFAYEKAELTPAGRQTLEQVVRFMNDQPELALDIWGHTDSKGAELYNLRLSQKRAAAVVEHLIASGIAASRLKSAGFGESRPLADNETDEGRERNRRVELNIRAPRSGGQP